MTIGRNRTFWKNWNGNWKSYPIGTPPPICHTVSQCISFGRRSTKPCEGGWQYLCSSICWSVYTCLLTGITGELATIYMENIQIRALSTSPYQLEQWFGILMTIKVNLNIIKYNQILNHVNSIEPGIIQITMEELVNDEIAVLDSKQKVDSKQKSMKFSLNWKKMHTYINVDRRSHNPEKIKRSIIKEFGNK